MLSVKESNKFKKSLKRVYKYKNFKQEKYEYVVSILVSELELLDIGSHSTLFK